MLIYSYSILPAYEIFKAWSFNLLLDSSKARLFSSNMKSIGITGFE